ncbi:hypothetical protein HK097_011637 [Rhizophlyctis rosea]|uniref:Uncharacterized protein n=1 Tax=Rhizophlyctis rosea TaxID=64517 RepID=A0AAD5S8T3_9FUNG|nr:hypothetical protein HK097_011637 [Rhizophlyctis rosea]
MRSAYINPDFIHTTSSSMATDSYRSSRSRSRKRSTSCPPAQPNSRPLPPRRATSLLPYRRVPTTAASSKLRQPLLLHRRRVVAPRRAMNGTKWPAMQRMGYFDGMKAQNSYGVSMGSRPASIIAPAAEPLLSPPLSPEYAADPFPIPSKSSTTATGKQYPRLDPHRERSLYMQSYSKLTARCGNDGRPMPLSQRVVVTNFIMLIQELCTDIGIGSPAVDLDEDVPLAVGMAKGQGDRMRKEAADVDFFESRGMSSGRKLEVSGPSVWKSRRGSAPVSLCASSYPTYDPNPCDLPIPNLIQIPIFASSSLQPSSLPPIKVPIKKPGSAKHRNRLRLLRLAAQAEEQPITSDTTIPLPKSHQNQQHKPTSPSPLRQIVIPNSETHKHTPTPRTSTSSSLSSASSAETLIDFSPLTDAFPRLRSFSLDIPRASLRPMRARTSSTDSTLSGDTLVWKRDEEIGKALSVTDLPGELKKLETMSEGRGKGGLKGKWRGFKRSIGKVFKGVTGDWEGREREFNRV